MQTGNSIYFGVGLTDPHSSTRWIKAGISIAAFCLGSFIFSRWHNTFSARKRWVVALSYIFQTVLIGVGAIIVSLNLEGRTPSASDLSWRVWIPIALLGFQSAGQAVLSRVIALPALSSVVLTSIYLDLFSDMKLFAVHNRQRNQRTLAPLALLVGAICGGLWAKSSIGMAGALWSAVLIKLLIIGGVLMAPKS
jgi:hypothetical protein